MAVRETYISKTLSALGDGVAKVDEKIKALLADKQILARILKYSVEEFKEYDILEIINRIEEVEILEVPVDAGLSHKSKNEFGKISGSNTEDNVPGEGVIFYDIRFNITKGKKRIKVLINIEAQATTSVSRLGYHIENRMTYYLSRMISAQKEQEFFGSDYDKIKEVISIWICMDARKNEDSIIEYQLRPEVKFGENIHPEEINLLKGILIKIRGGKNMTQSKNKLIEMLEYVIADHSVEEKKNYLKNECGVEMTKELERKVEAMGESMGRAILQGMLEDAWDKGVAQERRNTEKERENTQKEREHAIAAFISFGIPKEKILEKGYTEEEYTKVKKKLFS
ncbi:Hypothetical protein EHLA_1085 [Anaerobutyricum hallii]|uniref:PD-(D/E)XK nuclease family transposase n=1 Tax=Anaerobutyricum hallii TaxID=39488 RepID=A0A285PRC9_9FIRM|nr:hypothetical protein [Anaerobutyricum hallii]SOB71817.1 Hypothetical protein EHLA_1085 [Anaerobutyricum hallii]